MRVIRSIMEILLHLKYKNAIPIHAFHFWKSYPHTLPHILISSVVTPVACSMVQICRAFRLVFSSEIQGLSCRLPHFFMRTTATLVKSFWLVGVFIRDILLCKCFNSGVLYHIYIYINYFHIFLFTYMMIHLKMLVYFIT